MLWLLIGYMYLFIHRPFEIWPVLGTIRLELLYALFACAVWVMYNGKRWLPNPLHRAYFGLVAAVLVCWLASPWTSSGIDTIDKYLKMMVIYVLMVTVLHDEANLKRFGQAYLLIMTLYMVHSLIEFRNGRYHFRMETKRLIGVDITMADPNAFGATLVYGMALTPALWFASRTWRWRGFMVFYGLLTCGCVALTGSRSAFASLIAWGGLTILRSRWRFVFGAAAVAAAPLVWAALPPSLQNRFETIINPDAGPLSAKVSAEGRLHGLELGLQVFSRYPLTGCGPGAWRPATGSKLQSHNVYAQVLGELGVVGAVPFACIVLFYWLNVRRIKRIYREHGWEPDMLYQYAGSLGTALFLLLLSGNFAHNLFRYHWLWYGAFLIIVRHCVEQRVREAAYLTCDTEYGDDEGADADWDDLPAEGEAEFAHGGSHA